MSSKRAPGRSLDEWMELVIQCRQSGLTDAAWCNEHGISPSCFYNAVTELVSDKDNRSKYLDNPHTIEIEARGLMIRMNNTVHPSLLKILMDALKEPLC